MPNSWITTTTTESDSLAFRGERDYIHSSDFLGFLESILSPRDASLKLVVDFKRPIRSQVRLLSGEQLDAADSESPLAWVNLSAGIDSQRFGVVAAPELGAPQRRDEARFVVSEAYRPDGFSATLSANNLTDTLYSMTSCVKRHWQMYEPAWNQVPMVRRVDLTLPFSPPHQIDSSFQRLKFGAKRWSFKGPSGDDLDLRMHVFLLHLPSP